jgi:hypothetical protein
MRSESLGVLIFLVSWLPQFVRGALSWPLNIPVDSHKTPLIALVFISHGILVDAVVLVAATCKDKKWYQWVHLLTSYLLVALLFIECLITGIAGFGFAKTLQPSMDLFTLIILVSSKGTGHLVQRIIRAEVNGRTHHIHKRIHRATSIPIWVIFKAKFMVLMKLSAKEPQHFWLFALIYTFVCVVVYGYLFFFSDPDPKDNELSSHYKRHDGRRFRDILDSLRVHSARNVWANPSEEAVIDTPISIRRTVPVRWYLFGNRLCELPSFPHSGGNFLIEASVGKDITKEALGIYPWVYRNESTNKIHLFLHEHGKKFRNEIQRACFGILSVPVFRRRLERSLSFDTDEKVSLIANRSHDRDYKRHKMYEHMGHQITIGHSLAIPETVWHVLFISKEPESACDYVVDLKQSWPQLLGKYLLANFQLHGQHLCQHIRFLSPNYLRFRSKFLAKVDKEIYSEHLAANTKLLEQAAELKDVVSADHLSNFCVTVIQGSQDVKLDRFTMSDHLGFGLGWLTTASGEHVIVARNEGIVPFIDLFEMIFQKLMFYAQGKRAENEIFDAEYRHLFSESLKLHVYWEVSGDFLEAASTLGGYHLRLIKRVQERLRSPDTELIGRVWVAGKAEEWVGDGVFEKSPFDVFNAHKVFDLVPHPEKVFVSGSADFRTTLFHHKRIGPQHFDKFIFI